MTKQAHAVYDINRQELFANSVHDTPQGAMVNGLLLCFGVITPAHWTYEQIKKAWMSRAGLKYCIVTVHLATDGHAVRL